MSGCTTLRILLGVGSIVYEYHLVRHELGGEKRTRSRADITAHIYDRHLGRANTLSPRTRRCCKSENQLCKSNHTDAILITL
jgi:hypothetical protein